MLKECRLLQCSNNNTAYGPVSRTLTNFSVRAFSAAGTRVWNGP